MAKKQNKIGTCRECVYHHFPFEKGANGEFFLCHCRKPDRWGREWPAVFLDHICERGYFEPIKKEIRK